MAKVTDVDTAAPTEVPAGNTKFGKEVSIFVRPGGRMFGIKVSGGGVFPPSLAGDFTSPEEAKAAIARWGNAGNPRKERE